MVRCSPKKKKEALLTSIEDIKKVNKKIRQKSWTKTCCAHKNPMSHLAKANFLTIWNRREDGWETFLERKFVFCDVSGRRAFARCSWLRNNVLYKIFIFLVLRKLTLAKLIYEYHTYIIASTYLVIYPGNLLVLPNFTKIWKPNWCRGKN